MKTLRYTALVFALALLFQIAYTTIVAAIEFHAKHVDVFGAQNTLFQTEAKGIVYSLPIIAAHANKPLVVILGASNANLGLRPDEIEPLVHGIQVNNLSIGGQNMRTLSELVDLIYRQTPERNRHNLVFVVGSWYGLTVDDSRRWPTGRTDVDQELLRYGIFSDPGAGKPLRQRVPDAMLSSAFIATWPLMLPYAVEAETSRALLRRGVLSTLPSGVIPSWYPPKEVRNTETLTEPRKIQDVKSFDGYVGPVSEWKDTGFTQLIALGNDIAANGSKLILVDLPVASQATTAIGVPAYSERMAAVVAQLKKNPGFTYANLQGSLEDNDYFDLVHPRPRSSIKLAQKVATLINLDLAK